MLNNTEFVDIEAEMLSTNGTTRNPPGQDNGPRSHFINRGFAPSVSVPSVKSFSLVPFLFSSFCEIRIAAVLVVGREKMKTCGETRLHVPDYLITISDQCKSGARLRASCSIMPWPVFLPDSSLSLQYSSIWSFRCMSHLAAAQKVPRCCRHPCRNASIAPHPFRASHAGPVPRLPIRQTHRVVPVHHVVVCILFRAYLGCLYGVLEVC